MLNNLVNTATEEEDIPEILGERCVHNYMEQASCRACVDACPKEAWVLDDEQLGIDPEACDNCGLCAPVCPEGAIQHDHAPMIGQWKERVIAMSTCENSDVSGFSKATIPCVHALGLHNLLTMHKQGCAMFITATGDCDQCERGANPRLTETSNVLNGLLGSRALPLFKSENFAPRQWESLAKRLSPFQPDTAMSRRNFFRKAMVGVTEQGLMIAGLRESKEEQYIPVGKLLPEGVDDDCSVSFPYVPTIDSTRCNGCDACIRLCPHEAIQLMLDEDDGRQYFQLNVELCTNCRICIDVCEEGAVSIALNAQPKDLLIPLENQQCDACGVEYHQPQRAEEEQQQESLCRICSVTNHSRNLFQVYD